MYHLFQETVAKKETVLNEFTVEPRPCIVASDHPVEKQRAIVKPHILTHVIEGFVIQEGPEPFPVSTVVSYAGPFN